MLLICLSLLGIPCVRVSAAAKTGLDELMKAVIDVYEIDLSRAKIDF